MLVIDGQIHPAFIEGSTNLNIRNGIGILPDNEIIFAMSKEEINFYDSANYFKSLGCKNALYLNGLVLRTYLPEKEWSLTDGNFGVTDGVTKIRAPHLGRPTKPHNICQTKLNLYVSIDTKLSVVRKTSELEYKLSGQR